MKDITTQLESCSFEEGLDLLAGYTMDKKLGDLYKSKKLTVDSMKTIFDTGIKLYNNFQFKEAEVVFLSYISINPYDHRGIGCLASIYLERGKFREAMNLLNILKSYPTNDLDETILNMSFCHYKLKEYEDAKTMLLIVKKENLKNDFYIERYSYLKQELENK